MNTVSTNLAALLAMLTATGTAQAQAFDGPSVGVQGGWTRSDLRNPMTDLGMAPIDATQDSAVLGFNLGYDKEIGKFVLGGETGLSFGIDDMIESGAGQALVSIDPKRTFDISARAGYLVTLRTLVYGRAGYTNERIRTTLTSAAGMTIASEDRHGWLLGGGVEQKITDHVSARLEYRYADVSEGDNKYDRHQLLTGFSYRF